jgi:signal transduction histidine kinase
MFMDITEKAHAEKIRREFSANVSHELKTPLTSISGYAEMLCGGFCSNEEDKLAFAGKIRDEAARLMSLINDVLLISELDEARNAENGMPPGGAPAGPAARGGGLGGIGAAGHGAFEDVDIAGVALEVVQSLAARARHCDVHVGIRRFGAAIASEAGLAADSAPPAAPNAARPAASGATWRVAAEDVSASAAAAAANATNAADFANAAADSANAAAYAAAAADVPAGAADSAAGSVIRANRVMAFEMLYNLVDNAIKYNKPGGSVMVDIRRAGGRLSVAVSDTGIGIPKEAQGRVFERFFRVDKSRSRKTGGTGLGLAIVKHVAQTHDAAIALESRLGEGTSVTLEFAPQKL